MGFSSVREAIDAIGRLGMAVVVDDEDRENEGDLVMAAEAATPENIAFFLAHTSGVICVPLLPERADALDLPLMVTANTEAQRTAFTVSVDFRHGTTTGISAADRASTIAALIDKSTRPHDLNRPGHIFPLRYRTGGVLKRAGHTEATVDLSRRRRPLARGRPVRGRHRGQVGDGPPARPRTVRQEARPPAHLHRRPHSLPPPEREAGAARVRGRASRPRAASSARSSTSPCSTTSSTSLWSWATSPAPRTCLVRVHSECLTGDVFGSLRCDCGPQLHAALDLIEQEGRGVLIYLRGHEGRGIGLGHKIRAYQLQEEGHDTVDANLQQGLPVDSREYGIGAQMLVDLGVTTMRLMTNNPVKYGGLEGFGLDITERVPLQPSANPENIAYLRTKRERMGHLLHGLDEIR